MCQGKELFQSHVQPILFLLPLQLAHFSTQNGSRIERCSSGWLFLKCSCSNRFPGRCCCWSDSNWFSSNSKNNCIYAMSACGDAVQLWHGVHAPYCVHWGGAFPQWRKKTSWVWDALVAWNNPTANSQSDNRESDGERFTNQYFWHQLYVSSTGFQFFSYKRVSFKVRFEETNS